MIPPSPWELETETRNIGKHHTMSVRFTAGGGSLALRAITNPPPPPIKILLKF